MKQGYDSLCPYSYKYEDLFNWILICTPSPTRKFSSFQEFPANDVALYIRKTDQLLRNFHAGVATVKKYRYGQSHW